MSVRGIKRKTIFRNDDDGFHFLKRLEILLEEIRFPRLPGGLSLNPFHFPLKTGHVLIAATGEWQDGVWCVRGGWEVGSSMVMIYPEGFGLYCQG